MKRPENNAYELAAMRWKRGTVDSSADPKIHREQLGLLMPLAGIIFGLLFLMPLSVLAETIEPPAYVDSIVSDEEGDSLRMPTYVCYDPAKDEIYVVDSKSRFLVYTSDLFPLFTFGKKEGIDGPVGLTVDGAGNVYVALSASQNKPRHRIAVFNARMKWDHDIFFDGFAGADSFYPYRMAVDREGKLYVAGYDFTGVLVLDSKGKLEDIIFPDEEGKQVQVIAVTIDKEGRIYLVSQESSRIYVYDSNRQFLFEFGEKGGSSGKLSRPLEAAVDNSRGRIYVVDYMRQAVNIYDKEGKYLAEFGGLGWGEGWFQYPNGLTVDDKGRIFVADMFNHRVQVFQAKE